jgi:hypothetical protein
MGVTQSVDHPRLGLELRLPYTLVPARLAELDERGVDIETTVLLRSAEAHAAVKAGGEYRLPGAS